ncbi:MAG: hypothetical protein SCK28_05685 [Bacillota bacterium]|nr:hypothetical protein [Bacillota bacterium]
MVSEELKLEEAIKAKVVDNRLSCAQAHIIAEELNVSLLEIGEKANEMKIKINKCQLGCF